MNFKEYCLLFTSTILGVTLVSCSVNNETVGSRQRITGTSSIEAKALMDEEAQSKIRVVSQCLKLDDNVSVLLERAGENLCLSQFSSFNNAACSGKPVDLSVDQKAKTHFDDIKTFFTNLDEVNHCAELRILRRAGNCRQWESISGGDGYELCTFPYDVYPREKRPGVECVFPYSGKCTP